MKKTHIVALVFIAIAITAVMGTVYKPDTYSNFNQAKNNPDKKYHIIGTVDMEKPMMEMVEKNTLYFTFHMTDDENNSSKVVYIGGKPQDFEKLEQVVLVGKYPAGADHTFLASEMLLKCPSKYNENEFGKEENITIIK